MTLEEAKQLQQYGVAPLPTVTVFDAIPCDCAPRPIDNMDHVVTPRKLTEKDGNGVSCRDVQAFHQFKYMDTLHRADSVSRMHTRSQRLRDAFVKDGGDLGKFARHYQK